MSDARERREPSRPAPPREPPRPDVSRAPGPPPGPQDIRISPFGGGFAAFTAIAIPIVVFGYTRSAGPDDVIIAIGVVIGLAVGLMVGLWLAHRGGRVWRGPQL